MSHINNHKINHTFFFIIVLHNQVFHHHFHLLTQIEFRHLLLPLYHRHGPPADFHNRCRNICSTRRSQSFWNGISWFCNSTWHIYTFVKKFSGGVQVCFDFHRCPREEKELMFHRCQSASAPALGIQVCLNPRIMHLSSVPEQPKFVGNITWLVIGWFDTIVLCQVFCRTLSKTVAIRFDVQIWHLVRIEARWIFSAVKADYQLTEELDYSGDLA